MTLRRLAWLCLLTGLGLAALAWFAWDGEYGFLLAIGAFLAVMSGSQLLTAAIQMPKAGAQRDEAGAP
jgi:uncharacterized membrane protein